MTACCTCVHDGVYACTHVGEPGATEFWIRKMVLRLFECSSSPKDSCVHGLPWLTPVIVLLYGRSCQLLNYTESYETARAAEH